MITGLYAAIFAIFAIALTINVIVTRIKDQIAFGNGENDTLRRKRSAHSNFLDLTPFFVILLFIIEYQNLLESYVIHALGVTFLLGRLFHAYGILKPPGYGLPRVICMVLTMVSVLACAGILLYFYALMHI